MGLTPRLKGNTNIHINTCPDAGIDPTTSGSEIRFTKHSVPTVLSKYQTI